MEIRNRTSHVVGWTVLHDKEAAEQLVVAVRGSWAIDRRGTVTPVAEEPPLQPVDLHAGEPGKSSVLYEADVGPMKPATDCVLVGSARARRGKVRQMAVSFRVGPVSRGAIVIGERRRLFWLVRWWNTFPKSFERTPLLWELAAGGHDTSPKKEKHHSLDLRNPLGRGFRGRHSKQKRRGSPLPQILMPRGFLGLLRSRAPAGFGLTGGHWAHRRRYAGTYDDAWRESRCPLLPLDFDERFHCAAAPGLATREHLRGGEAVEVRGCTREGRLTFTLPATSPSVRVTLDGPPEPVDMRIVTITVDTDAMRLRMLWRGSLSVHRRLPRAQLLEVASDGAGS